MEEFFTMLAAELPMGCWFTIVISKTERAFDFTLFDTFTKRQVKFMVTIEMISQSQPNLFIDFVREEIQKLSK